MRAARAAYCNYPFEVRTAYPWPKTPLPHTLPGSIVLARMAPCATSMKLSVPPFLPKTRLFRQDLSSPLRPSVLHPPPVRVSSALNFSKIIATSSLLNRRDNRCVASPSHRDWWLRSRGRAKRKTKLHSFESPVSSLAITQSGNLPFLPLLRQSSQPRYSIRNLLLI